MQRDPRPVSDVSSATGLVGLAGLFAWLLICRNWADIAMALDLPGPREPLSGPYAALAALLFSGTALSALGKSVLLSASTPNRVAWK